MWSGTHVELRTTIRGLNAINVSLLDVWQNIAETEWYAHTVEKKGMKWMHVQKGTKGEMCELLPVREKGILPLSKHTENELLGLSFKFMQVNLQRSMPMTPELINISERGKVDVILIQEPYVVEGKVNISGKVICKRSGKRGKVWSAIWMRSRKMEVLQWADYMQ